MSVAIDRISSWMLSLSACIICVLFIRREVINERVPSTGAILSPRKVESWSTYLAAGTRIGPEDAALTIVEFGDFECPACKGFYQTERRLRERFPNEVAVVYIHYPLSYHRFAGPAARAASCAAAQGRFSEIHDLLFAKQDSLGLKSWVSFAAEAFVKDQSAFMQCIARTDSIPEIASGLRAANAIKLEGTPRILVNGLDFGASVPDAAELENLLEQARAAR
jgi:protein-disulfide isomerase